MRKHFLDLTGRFLNHISILFLAGLAMSPALAETTPCTDHGAAQLWVSPKHPDAGKPVRVMVVSTSHALSELTVIDSGGNRIPVQSSRRGGPPWSINATLEHLDAGQYRIETQSDGKLIACSTLGIGKSPAQPKINEWNQITEALYSAWIEALFAAPFPENLSFPSLEPLLRNTDHNFLHNYLGLNEDAALPMTPDCADLPYILRSYFAWKMGLPFAFHACGRGSGNAPPRCSSPTLMTEFTRTTGTPVSFTQFSRKLVNTVHSGSARTRLDDESTDWYPVPLRRDALRPGTIFADPYGHILVLVEWVPQTAKHAGMLWAADAQPDNTITRKRVWEGTLLFAQTNSAGAGFKAFRPLISTAQNQWNMLSNAELTDQSEFIPFSLEQQQMAPDDFYAKLTKLINPDGLEPKQAYDAMFSALVEQIETRVTSIDNAEAHFRKNPRSVIPMPRGTAIFQTVGPWEDYSTPSRDMRLLIAMHVLNGLPDKVVRYPDLFLMHGKAPQAVKTDIEQYHAQRTHQQKIRYTRSDGSQQELSIAEVLARQSAYEMAYNPNDCVEKRWGAQPDSEEYATCRRHAPMEQRSKMMQYRTWFQEMRRPAQ
ncbi:hypothetical protein ABF87_04885 [Nitrosomonas sp. JL21]|uniref:hypothetical protein n=1 Tax=Nitrosomonas sp. JL21 TaxID=153949 RepID=UPI00136F84D8|nr:hypothetical protein [Nitrosomonas sp. JL21]MBL8496425.1 hypothetical protein [Nitrosomonas sp.]MCC7092152.1 hypothetical protein [Nitrosomonas sp.]MXS77303.1 hypothetical protein [Nitrosomonas sp. JL21]